MQISSYCVHIARTNHVSLLMRWGTLYLNGGDVTTADLICCQWVAFQFSPGKHNLPDGKRSAPRPQSCVVVVTFIYLCFFLCW